jgi:hypothetical protein
MKANPQPGLFKPTPPQAEAKGDATTRVSRQIIESEAAARVAKTERLRAARLAQELAAPVARPKKPPAKRLSKRA